MCPYGVLVRNDSHLQSHLGINLLAVPAETAGTSRWLLAAAHRHFIRPIIIIAQG